MKTNFLPRSKRQRGSKRREMLTLGAVFLVAALGFSFFGSSLTQVFAPLWRSHVLVRTGVTNLVGSLRQKDALIAENNRLKEQLASDEDLILSLRAIASSRDALLETFGRSVGAATPAGVLVHPPETPYDTLVLDAGDNVGVRGGSVVTTTEGIPIGTITLVASRTSQVRLYSTAGERTDAVLERGGVSVTLVGRGGGNMEFSLPRDLGVEVGDRVLLPTLSSELVAVVGDVEVSPTDSEKRVLVRSPSNPNNQRFVLILP